MAFVRTVIIVRGGMVCDVYSTLAGDDHEIELLDLDNAAAESPDARAAMEARIDEISASPDYQLAL